MLIAQKTHANCYSSAYYDHEHKTLNETSTMSSERCTVPPTAPISWGLPLSRQKKVLDFPWLFWTKLQAICRTNAHLSTKVLCVHHVWKMNYSYTNKVQVSYMMTRKSVHAHRSSCTGHMYELPRSNFHDYTNSPTFPWHFPDFRSFFLTVHLPWPNSLTFPGV